MRLVRRTTAALALGLALAGCAGRPAGQERPLDAGPRIATPIRLADCTDWRRASAPARLGTLHDLRNFAGGAVGSSPLANGRVLGDKQAYDLFQRFCSEPYARQFKLYKLYTRAASFIGH